MMKKLITLCFFALTFLFSTQGLDAQNMKEIKVAASEKTQEIEKMIKLSKDQLEEVYQAYKTFETSYQSLSKNEQANRDEIKILNVALDKKFKEIFNEDQFASYLAIFRSN